MKVMIVGPLGPDDFADNVRDSALTLGFDVAAVGPARPAISRHGAFVASQLFFSDRSSAIDRRQQARLVRRVSEFRPDVLLTVDRTLHKSVVEAAREQGARTALWFPDALGGMGPEHLYLAGYDRIYLKNPIAAERLVRIYGLPMSYLPEAANPRWHRSTVEYGSRKVIVVAGNIYPTRALLLDRLLASGVPLEIFGPPIPNRMDFPRVRAAHTGRYIARQEKADVFRSARAVLNNLHPMEFAGVNCRTFEVTASGGLALMEEREGLSELFTIGREVEVFSTYEELLTLANALLASPERGRQIANAAAGRAHRDHTYDQRLIEIIEDLVG